MSTQMAHGQPSTTTKQTFVSTYTSKVDPRTLPEFNRPGADQAMVTSCPQNASGTSSACAQEATDVSTLPTSSTASPLHVGYFFNPRAGRAYGGSVVHQQLPAGPQRGAHDGVPWDEDFPSPVGQPHAAADGVRRLPSSSTYSGSEPRLRKKYTTTTVTTVTTTTILLPKMQEALVMPSVTDHNLVRAPGQPRLLSHRGSEPPASNGGYHPPTGTIAAPLQRSSRSDTLPSSSQLVIPQEALTQGKDGSVPHQSWAFQQQNEQHIEKSNAQDRPPTLEELGIRSYFNRGPMAGRPSPSRLAYVSPPADGEVANGSNGSYPYMGMQNGQPRNQPWISSEVRDELEGGMKYREVGK